MYTSLKRGDAGQATDGADVRFLVLSLLFCVATGLLYSIGLASRSVWYDEAITLQSLAASPYAHPAPGFIEISALKPFLEGAGTFGDVIGHYVHRDVHPPLYFLIAHGATLIFGNDLHVVRAVSLILVLASVFLYGRALFRISEPGLWVCLSAYAFCFASATSAQDARGYGLAMLLVVAAWRMLAFAPARQPPAVGREVLLGLFCGGLMLTHYLSALVVAPLLGWRFVELAIRRDPRALAAPLACFAVFLPWLPVMLEHLGARPGQMVGFPGLFEWSKWEAQMMAAQVFSATHWGVPAAVQKVGRGLVLLLIAVGTLDALLRGGPAGPRRRFGRIAVWVPAAGLVCFLLVSVLLDRWFALVRYLSFFAPFLTYLAARGAVALGRSLGALAQDRAWVSAVPGAVLVSGLVLMLNFGWEANRNRGGAYYDTIADGIRDAGAENSLAVIDMAEGRGTLLSAALAFPAETKAYLLPPDPSDWTQAAADLRAALDTRDVAFLVYTVERGQMGSDKALLYGPIVNAFVQAGFKRTVSFPADPRAGYYAKWERAGGT